MNIEELVRQYAKEHGFTGLLNYKQECGCSLSEHFPCDKSIVDCEFAYATECINCKLKDECDKFKKGYDMCIRSEKI